MILTFPMIIIVPMKTCQSIVDPIPLVLDLLDLVFTYHSHHSQLEAGADPTMAASASPSATSSTSSASAASTSPRLGSSVAADLCCWLAILKLVSWKSVRISYFLVGGCLELYKL